MASWSRLIHKCHTITDPQCIKCFYNYEYFWEVTNRKPEQLGKNHKYLIMWQKIHDYLAKKILCYPFNSHWTILMGFQSGQACNQFDFSKNWS